MPIPDAVSPDIQSAYFAAFPERDQPRVRQAFACGEPGLGLTPGEVLLLQGEPARFGVTPDPTVWVEGSDPVAVMAAQTKSPDGSLIWIDVESVIGCRRIHFERGRAIRMEDDPGV